MRSRCKPEYGLPTTELPAFNLTAALIARDATQDIATFAVPEAMVAHVADIPLDRRVGRSSLEPRHSWLLNLCGFPESMRLTRRGPSAELRAWGALATVECVTRDEIIISYDPTIGRPAAWGLFMPALRFNMSRCSGGPVLGACHPQ